MRTVLKPSISIIFPLVVLIGSTITVGCGEGFQSMQTKSGVSPAGSELVFQEGDDPNNYLDQYLEMVSATPSSKAIQMPTMDSELYEFSTDLNLRFGSIARTLGYGAFLGEAYLSRKCYPWDFRYFPPGKDYDCGELPYGSILDDNRKLIYEYEVEDEVGTSDGVNYQVFGDKIFLYLDRQQSASTTEISTLDRRGTERVSIEQGILDNLFFRLSPEAGSLGIDLCLVTPGLNIYSSSTKLRVKAEKRVLFFRIKGDAEIDATLGSLSFDSAKFCTSFQIESNSSGDLDFSLTDIKTPEFSGLRHTGVVVAADFEPRGILKLISGVLRVFGLNIERKIENKIREDLTEEINEGVLQFITEDLESGEYIHKLLSSQGIMDQVVDNLESQTDSVVSRGGVAGSKKFADSLIASICDRINLSSEALAEQSSSQLLEICAQGISAQTSFFLKDPQSEEAGCYDHYFKVTPGTERRSEWWSRECKIRNHIQVTAPKKLVPLAYCLLNTLNQSTEELLSAEACESEKRLLSEILDKQGISLNEIILSRLEELKGSEELDPFQENIAIFLESQIEDYFD